MRYISKVKTIDDFDADNALILGTAMHEAIEMGVDVAIKRYYRKYPIITDSHGEEAKKIEYKARQALSMLPRGGMFEYELKTPDFVGYIDYLVCLDDGTCQIWDFKYSNSDYKRSEQLHLYKYFYEKTTGHKVSSLRYLMIPKRDKAPYIKEVVYNPSKVIEFLLSAKALLEAKEFDKKPNSFCYFCEYRDFCERGLDYMLLPENKRRNVSSVNKKVLWIYGAPFSGKTWFANSFPDPLMLNTDGNIRFVDAPYLAIKNDVMVEGRITKTTLAWEVFKDIIFELEKKQNDFKTIVVDLLEDLYEHCRIYMYEKMGINHESDNSFKAWDMVRTEFLSTLKRLMNLDYENIILISHEDASKDITKKTGDKITSIRPNIGEKLANKIAGMVDIVARVYVDGDDRILSFKSDDVIFGGGRISVEGTDISLSYDALLDVYAKNNEGKEAAPTVQEVLVEAVAPEVENVEVAEEENVTSTRRRRRVRE